MRVFAVSDIHVDFEANRRWVEDMSDFDYISDTLILAGDISHNFNELTETLLYIKKKFGEVLD